MAPNKSKLLFIFFLIVTVVFAVSMRLQPAINGISLSEDQPTNEQLLTISNHANNGSASTSSYLKTSETKTNIEVKTELHASEFGQSKSEFEAMNTPKHLSHSDNVAAVNDKQLNDPAQRYEIDFDKFNTDFSHSITTKDYAAFDDYALMMQDSHLINQPCNECRQLFVDVLQNPLADLEFRVLSMEALSGLENYETALVLVNEFISHLVRTTESNSDPTTVTLSHEFKQTILDSDNNFNLKALVDYYIGKTDVVIDYPLSVLGNDSRLAIELEISKMLSEYYDRELIAQVLWDSVNENPGHHAQSQLMNLNYPELYVELALAAQQSGLINDKEYYINHIYQNLSPDNTLRGIFELSSKNLETPEYFYTRTTEWAQQNIGSYSETYDEIFSNYHHDADRSIKSVAIALTGNLYDENKAKSILNSALSVEIDPYIRQMIFDELLKLNDIEQS